MAVQYSTIFAYIVGIILLFILGRLFLVPIKIVLRLFYNALLGGLVLFTINLVGGMLGFHIPLNIFTAVITGFLGIPGIIVLIIFKYMNLI